MVAMNQLRSTRTNLISSLQVDPLDFREFGLVPEDLLHKSTEALVIVGQPELWIGSALCSCFHLIDLGSLFDLSRNSGK